MSRGEWVLDRREAVSDAGMVAAKHELAAEAGARVTAKGTGVLLNNAMMWFDPEPGRPNSIEGGKRPLSNMAPVLVLDGERALMTAGAMGGRRIINAVAQIIANVLDHGMGMQAAITAPRVDCSTEDIVVSDRIDAGVIEGLRERGHRILVARENVGNVPFASPAGILRAAGGPLRGGANPYYPALAVGI